MRSEDRFLDWYEDLYPEELESIGDDEAEALEGVCELMPTVDAGPEFERRNGYQPSIEVERRAGISIGAGWTVTYVYSGTALGFTPCHRATGPRMTDRHV